MEKKLIGVKIKSIREMTPEEVTFESWQSEVFRGTPKVVELDNGIILYASRDEEGNEPGEIFGRDLTIKDGQTGFML